jgi:hypothetical protein
MPNPLAHPAAAVPFTKAGMVFSALVIGSISPDFWYVIRVGPSYFANTLTGLFLFDVPVGLVLLWLFHTLAKWPLLSILPQGWQCRLFSQAQGFTWGPVKRFGLILLSLATGSGTHILWDSFTHDFGWMVEHLTFLSTPIAGIPLYSILQNLGTLLGIGILLYWFIRWFPKAPQGEQLPAHFSIKVKSIFVALTIVSLVVVEGAILFAHFFARLHHLLRHFMLVGSLSFSAVFIIGLFVSIYCLTWMLAFHKTTRRLN